MYTDHRQPRGVCNLLARSALVLAFLGINELRAQAMKAASRIVINIHEQGGAAIARLGYHEVSMVTRSGLRTWIVRGETALRAPTRKPGGSSSLIVLALLLRLSPLTS